MKIKEISFGKNRKLGLLNYSSVDVHVGITVSLDADDQDYIVQFDEMKKIVQEQLDQELKKYEPKKKTQLIPLSQSKPKLDEHDPSMDWPAYKPKNG